MQKYKGKKCHKIKGIMSSPYVLFYLSHDAFFFTVNFTRRFHIITMVQRKVPVALIIFRFYWNILKVLRCYFIGKDWDTLCYFQRNMVLLGGMLYFDWLSYGCKYRWRNFLFIFLETQKCLNFRLSNNNITNTVWPPPKKMLLRIQISY